MAAVVIPASDAAATAAQAAVTAIQTLVTNIASNPAQFQQYTDMLNQAQILLVQLLMARPKGLGVSAASIIANSTYGS